MQKTIILVSSLFLACAVHAQSADGGNVTDTARHPGMHRTWDRNREGFRGRIHYSPEQRKQLAAINKDYHKQAADLFKNDNQTLGQYKASLIALQKDRKSKMQALLTPEQKQQLENRKRRASENMQVMAAARMERLKIHLSLSDQQVATIKSKEADLHNKMKDLRENDNLLPQQKMEQFKQLGDQRRDIVKSVLTPDQLAKFNDMGHGMGGRRMHRDGSFRDGMHNDDSK